MGILNKISSKGLSGQKQRVATRKAFSTTEDCARSCRSALSFTYDAFWRGKGPDHPGGERKILQIENEMKQYDVPQRSDLDGTEQWELKCEGCALDPLVTETAVILIYSDHKAQSLRRGYKACVDRVRPFLAARTQQIFALQKSVRTFKPTQRAILQRSHIGLWPQDEIKLLDFDFLIENLLPKLHPGEHCNQVLSVSGV